MTLIDFHTHAAVAERYRSRPDLLVIRSLMPEEAPDDRSDLFTVGIHPMDEGRYHDPAALIEERRRELGKRFFGIGECGWDRRSPLSEVEQTERVGRQVELADRLGCPVIFHVVGGWHLLLRERKRHPEGCWLVHGFRGKPALLRQLEDAGIGVSLHPAYQWEQLPAGLFFLETDESEANISDLYRTAAERLGCTVEALAAGRLAALRKLPITQ